MTSDAEWSAERLAIPARNDLVRPGPIRDLWGRAAVRERFQTGDLLRKWLETNQASPDLQRHAKRAAVDLQQLAKPALAIDGSPALRLSERDRVTVLKAIGSDMARSYLAEVPPEERTVAEDLLVDLLDGQAVATDSSDRERLVALAQVAPLAEAAGVAAPSGAQAARRQVESLDFMNAVGGPDLHRFVGRVEPLRRLHWAWRTRVPLVEIEAPGGMGKSMLIARFVSELLADETDRPVAVFHLDFDRRDLQSARPATVLAEFVRQAARWMTRPESQEAAQRLAASSTVWASEDEYGQSRALESLPNRDLHVARELDALLRLQARGDYRAVIVADSAEQVFEFADLAAMSPQLAADELRSAGAQIMTIYGARHFPEGWWGGPRSRVILKVLSTAEASAYLQTEAVRLGVSIGPAEIKRVLKIVGRSPLALRFAARLLADDDAGDPGSWVDAVANDPERVQAVLYDRVLRRIRDPNLRKLARPGLLLRRLTREVIAEVLAKPCDLDLSSASPEALLASARRAEQLFHREPSDPRALWHRADVRALMLPALDASIPADVAKAINMAAVDFYARFDDPISRCEELYHRLRLNQSSAEIEPRWRDDAGERLKGALDDFPPAARSFARMQLGAASASLGRQLRTPDVILPHIEHAYEEGESDLDAANLIELRHVVRRELQRGAAPLETLVRYGVDDLTSPLGDVFAESLVVAGRWSELLSRVHELRSARRTGRREIRAAVFATTAAVLEGRSRLAEALDYWSLAASEAGEAATFGTPPDSNFRLTRLGVEVGRARTRRKLRSAGADIRRDELLRLLEMATPQSRELYQRTVLLRELTAEVLELGSGPNGQLLRQCIDWFSALTERQEAFPSAVGDDQRTAAIARALEAPEGWPIQDLGSFAVKQLYGRQGSGDGLQPIVRLLREEVDWTLEKAVSRPVASS